MLKRSTPAVESSTAQDLYSDLRLAGASVRLATIHRTLAALVAAGQAVRRCRDTSPPPVV